jgi:hypothetical protein
METNKKMDLIIVGAGLMAQSISKVANITKELGNVILLEDNEDVIVVNGIKYVPKQKSNKRNFVTNNIYHKTFLDLHIDNYLKDNYTRSLSKDIDIIKEYGLIQNKQSNLSRWERDMVVYVFEKTYVKYENL